MMKYKRNYRGISATSELIVANPSAEKQRTAYLVSKDGFPDYKTSAALTHKEAVEYAVLFWIKKGLIND